MDLEMLKNRVVIVKYNERSWLCDVTSLLTDPRCFGMVTQELVRGFERFERAHSERYLSKVVSLGRIGLLTGASVAAISQRALVPLIGEEESLVRRYGQDDLQHTYWSGNTKHLLSMPSDALDASDAVLIVTDALLGGHTLLAAAEFVRSTKAEVLGILALVEVQQLGGRARLERAGYSVESILDVPPIQN